ncbi:MAG: ubiquitin-like protein Pup [Actinobacteria bacterium]|jgi:ubiquitin-like protein Pup|nr:ubiquitin-like protein Pup [Actinomycetota bacterium]MCO5301431.1 ubiquitin-like protein Pup [Candidatus Nanopelagicales bacterium]MCB9428622.1 ubiquitin-like protein Pup [Actinomycetota bacterium]HPE11588.1 ubiquitin-like protein Pup [Actinomycetota bacterium]HPJ18296.1 ubiquitin-like protein Pup [Actinomycetota bacterium]
MADGQEHKQRTHSTGESEDVVGEQLDAASARKAEIDADVDSILDEIDDVLEENAEEFVASFVQKGGQ